MNKENVIEKLRNDEHYYGDSGVNEGQNVLARHNQNE